MAKRHLEQYDKNGNMLDIYLNEEEVMVGDQTLAEKLADMEDDIDDAAQTGGEGTVTGVKVGSNTYEPTEGVVDISGAVPTSTNDLSNDSGFTTKTYVDAAVQAVQTALDNLMNGQNVTDAIDTFNEVKAFLEGINNQETLAAKLATLVPQTRTINGKALSNNITLSQSDIPGLVAALAAKVGYSDDEWWQVKAGAIQAATSVPNTTTVNGKRLNDNITIQMADIPGLLQAISEAGEVKSVTINGTNHTPNSSGVVDLGTIQGEKGDKGDTGNVQVDGNGNVLIVNNLEEGGTGAALSAEMGKRLAMMSGTYAQAWARSKAITSPFCFLWIETVNGDAISKPIWHKGNSVFVDAAGAIINVTASSVPAAPTITGATSGSTVPKNTQITITPASGSALYYSIDGGTTYNVSEAAVTIKLETAGSVSIVAYCANNAGNSSNATLSVTVAGTAVPSFSQPSGEVARGGSVAISVPAGGELHYKVGSGSWQTASGTSASVQITGNTTIQAYNVQDGDTSSTITNNYTMAALASPTFSVATGTEFPATGGSVELTGPTGATIYYTTDGNTPTTSSTQYSSAIQVNEAMTIKAIAVDAYGSSAVAEASYTLVEDKIIIDTTDTTTTVNIGEHSFALDSTEYRPDSTTYYRNVITEGQLIAAGITGKTLDMTFSDNSKIGYFYGGGFTFYSQHSFFGSTTASRATALKRCEINIAVKQGGDSLGSYLFKYVGSGNWGSSTIVVSGTLNGLYQTFDAKEYNYIMTVDISGLRPSGDNGFTNVRAAFGKNIKTLIIGEHFKVSSSAEYTSSMFSSDTKLTTLKVMSSTPPVVSGSGVFNWLDQLMGLFPSASIKVPSGSLATYQSADGWSTYSERISEYS